MFFGRVHFLSGDWSCWSCSFHHAWVILLHELHENKWKESLFVLKVCWQSWFLSKPEESLLLFGQRLTSPAGSTEAAQPRHRTNVTDASALMLLKVSAGDMKTHFQEWVAFNERSNASGKTKKQQQTNKRIREKEWIRSWFRKQLSPEDLYKRHIWRWAWNVVKHLFTTYVQTWKTVGMTRTWLLIHVCVCVRACVCVLGGILRKLSQLPEGKWENEEFSGKHNQINTDGGWNRTDSNARGTRCLDCCRGDSNTGREPKLSGFSLSGSRP